MKESLNQKIVSITDPAAVVDNAAFNTATIDTRGFGQLTVALLIGALDVGLSVLKLRESDSADMSNAVDVTGANFATDATLPTAADDNKMYAFHVDLRGRKRFIDLQMTGGDGAAGTYAASFAILSRGQEMPDTAAKRGYAAELFV
jgi:hypothetical protein